MPGIGLFPKSCLQLVSNGAYTRIDARYDCIQADATRAIKHCSAAGKAKMVHPDGSV